MSKVKQVGQKTKVYFNQNIKEWRWWYKFIVGVIVISGLLITLISGIINISWLEQNLDGTPRWWLIHDEAAKDSPWQHWDYDGNITMFFMYFTNQTNLLVLFWIAVSLVKREGQGKLLGFNGSILTATYISITSIIWMTMLFPARIIGNVYSPWYEWLASVFLHVIGPIMFVLYVVLWSNQPNRVLTRQWAKKSWMVMIYVFIYGVVNLIRGEIRLQSGRSAESSYPYFFLEIHSTNIEGVPGYVWFFIALAAIIGIAIGMSTLYVFAINKLASKTK